MKIAITGHCAGIGKAIYDKLADNGHELIGFDIADESGDILNGREEILEKSKDCEVFINNAFHMNGAQTDMFNDIYMALPSFLGGASDEEEKAIMEERAGRKSAIEPDVNPMDALNKTESSDDKLKRLKQQQQQQELDGAVSNIVNVANSTNSNTSVAVNPTVPKSTSADAMALNA